MMLFVLNWKVAMKKLVPLLIAICTILAWIGFAPMNVSIGEIDPSKVIVA